MTVIEGINIKVNLLGFVIPTERFKSIILTFLYNSTVMSGDNLLSAPKASWSFSYSEPLPAIPNTTTCPFHPNTSHDTSSKGCSETSASSKASLETSSNSMPSDLNSAPTFLGYSWGYSGDEVAPAASNINSHIIRVICDIKG